MCSATPSHIRTHPAPRKCKLREASSPVAAAIGDPHRSSFRQPPPHHVTGRGLPQRSHGPSTKRKAPAHQQETRIEARPTGKPQTQRPTSLGWSLFSFSQIVGRSFYGSYIISTPAGNHVICMEFFFFFAFSKKNILPHIYPERTHSSK